MSIELYKKENKLKMIVRGKKCFVYRQGWGSNTFSFSRGNYVLFISFFFVELYLLLMEDRGGNEYCSCPVDGHRVIRNQGWMNRSLEAMQETHITCKHLGRKRGECMPDAGIILWTKQKDLN